MTTYYERNREAILAKRKADYENNKEKQLAYNKQWRQQNPERFQEYRKRWEKKSPTYIMYHNAKRRAAECNIPFDLDWKSLEIPENCPILGIKLGTHTRESTASLDRVIPSLGYVNSNVRIISMRANRLKNDATVEELQKILEYMKA